MESTYIWGFASNISNEMHDIMPKEYDFFTYLGCFMFLLGNVINAITHWRLRAIKLRKGEKEEPAGWLYDYVNFPNYTGEMMTWLGFAVMVKLISATLQAVTCCVICISYAYEKKTLYKIRGWTLRNLVIPFIFWWNKSMSKLLFDFVGFIIWST